MTHTVTRDSGLRRSLINRVSQSAGGPIFARSSIQAFDRRRLAVEEFVRSAVATLEPVYVKLLGFNVDVRELYRAQLRNPQPVAEHQKQNAIIPFGVACAALARRQKLVQLLRGEVFTGSFSRFCCAAADILAHISILRLSTAKL
jgi:hypothetical protein